MFTKWAMQSTGDGHRAVFLVLSLIIAGWPVAALGQARNDDAPINPLATKQEMIEERIARLEDRMFRLRERLSESEPENAKKLAMALEQAGRLDVKGRTAEIVELLRSAGKLDVAHDRQRQLVDDLELLLNALLDRSPDDAKRREEMKRLAQIKEDIDKLLKEQRSLRQRSVQSLRNNRMLAQLDAAIDRVAKLIEQQQKLAKELKQNGVQDAQNDGDQGSVQKRQADLARQAERAAQDVKRLARQKKKQEQTHGANSKTPNPDGQKNSNGEKSSPGDQEQNGQPPESKPSGESKANQSKPDGDKGGENSDGRPSADPKPDPASKPSDDASRAMKDASKSLGESGESMKDAAQRMAEKDQQGADKEQKEAIEKLRRALLRLEQARNELEKKSDQDDADAQKRLAQKAGKLSKQMKGGQDSGGEQQGSQKNGQKNGEQQQGGQQQGGKQQQGGQQEKDQQQGGQKSGQQPPSGDQSQTPGQPNVERAERHMKKAGDELEDQEQEDAIEDQDKALAELEQAQQELEQMLRQLREEEQEEILQGLEQRLAQMSADQKAINIETIELRDAIGSDAPDRAQRLQAAGLSERQLEITKSADGCVRLLEEDGTTVVFFNVIRQMSEDMRTVATRLLDTNLGPITTRTQSGVLETIDELLAAIKKLREDKKKQGQGGGGGGGGGGDPPLVPTSAELRMLKSSQKRVNLQTAMADEAKQGKGESESDVANLLRRAADRQAKLTDMALELQQRAEKGM